MDGCLGAAKLNFIQTAEDCGAYKYAPLYAIIHQYSIMNFAMKQRKTLDSRRVSLAAHAF